MPPGYARNPPQAAHPTRRPNPQDLAVLPSNDLPTHYDPPSPSSATSSSSRDDVYSTFVTNEGNKLEPNARWQRVGKMCSWGPTFDETQRDRRTRKRMRLCLEQLLPESAAELGVPAPQNIVDAEERRRTRKKLKQEDDQYLLPHLRSPSPPLSTEDLAPMLALPRSYLDIVTSPAFRYSLGDDTMERGLQHTAADLLEGEKGLMQALGRMREVLRMRERDVPPFRRPAVNGEASGTVADGTDGAVNGIVAMGANGHAKASNEERIPPLPHVSDTDNLWRVTQELLNTQPAPEISFSATKPGTAADPPQPSSPTTKAGPKLTPVHRLFTCPDGLTLEAKPVADDPRWAAMGPNHHFAQRHIKYNLDLPTQQHAVDDALERIWELLADCNEYKERLEEARERVSDVARVRKAVWKVIKRRAGRELNRMEGKNV
ncbi:hypothetical protein CcaverHIS002_0310170 [Cutaneotrichosporon cavernicola]|uniref:Transcriptional regulatory protein RXT2 N-terminal domain-containing protein n=1 Tax=Cutaneotrichosporon cavernicola TaxID=279322 RepID=A0AA48IDG5_9TREE|nr:uncharacterized protein CcaverHIS019_0310020 [Cutaneotrichosporon cavernicola]BEI83149.1 hypothetical protein CcaverHIS002_0310170 [Cutaneotrichosporon cavernicola]BEI90932.1 hypothetical protein CcaverHIS019_0310020 [Cutaneotrichosporon cavernicola]BEI98711.1 hypothetical protein CcaverHIS631_0310100 [Cutaneotrichosporon cavernicola]BEJ06481.1 hypothetical protein CcaverHIS641_0310030 [Cutaneotrichosporon cavernicola]